MSDDFERSEIKMAGVKGMKGGGGRRPGAGRKPDPAVPVAGIDDSDPLVFLRKAWMGTISASPTQVKAATAALPFFHQKRAENGKKAQRDEDAASTAGKFSGAAEPPKLVAAGGKKV